MRSRDLLRRLNRIAGLVLQRLPAGRDAGRALAPWRRILLAKLVGMGDAVLIRSLAEHLRGLRPDADIGVLAGPATREILGVNSSFRVHHYDPAGADRGLLRTWAKVREIREQSYEVVIDFEQHIVLVSLFLRLARIPHRIGLAAAGHPRARFQTRTVQLSGEESMWEAYRALVRVAAPAMPEVSTLPLPRSSEATAAVEQWWNDRRLDHGHAVALHLGSGSRAAARRWPVQRFVDLAERLRACGQADAVVLTGTREEAPLAQEFARAYTGRAVDATGLGSLERAAELLRRCRLVVSNDTGVMHLAAAMGAPTVGLFGPNSPRRYAPVGPRTASVYTTDVPCSPCINVHQGIVPECFHPEKGRCLLDIDVETVVRTAMDLLTRPAPPPAL